MGLFRATNPREVIGMDPKLEEHRRGVLHRGDPDFVRIGHKRYQEEPDEGLHAQASAEVAAPRTLLIRCETVSLGEAPTPIQ